MKLFVDYDLTPLPSRGSREWMSALAAWAAFMVTF